MQHHKTVAEAWEHVVHMLNLTDCPDDLATEFHRFFYSGSMAVISIILSSLDRCQSEDNTADLVKTLETLVLETNTWSEQVIKDTSSVN